MGCMWCLVKLLKVWMWLKPLKKLGLAVEELLSLSLLQIVDRFV
ncbi:hypothetical protein Gohar_020896, partial [Gossypium harknessii]|nr:hypothetical protein [Gossypium harknessii]